MDIKSINPPALTLSSAAQDSVIRQHRRMQDMVRQAAGVGAAQEIARNAAGLNAVQDLARQAAGIGAALDACTKPRPSFPIIELSKQARENLALAEAEGKRNHSVFSSTVIEEFRRASRRFENLHDYGVLGSRLAEIQRSFSAPHLDYLNPPWATSLESLSRLSQAVRHLPPFQDELVGIMRDALGDWRGVDIPERILNVPERRIELYEHAGFDPGLTRFEEPEFEEALVVVGLMSPADRAPAENKTGYDKLFALETALRRFITKKLEAVAGGAWLKQRVDGDIRQRCKEKCANAVAAGQAPRPLLEYADLDDYRKIIVRDDNWREAFSSVFGHKSFVDESFRQLQPPRRAIAHMRPLSEEDLLVLVTESWQLFRAMGSTL